MIVYVPCLLGVESIMLLLTVVPYFVKLGVCMYGVFGVSVCCLLAPWFLAHLFLNQLSLSHLNP